tara:strand:+ start:880 stop:1305 length:426 start_codon:yes stop_codon:yes gene_type:complete
MATINATVSITSDITSYPISINKSMTMKKAGSCHGLEETTGLNSKKFNAVTAVEIIGNAEGTADGANKVYIRNTGSSKTDYFYVALNDNAAAATTTETIGKLYGGDWMLMPWEATANTSHDIVVAPSTAETMTIEWMAFVE